jgi:hypothetical protein
VTNISVNSIKYRLNVNSIENNGVWTGFNQSVKDFLNESAGMIGDFDIFYEGLDDLSSSEIELKPLDSTNQTYELEFTNYLGDLYSIPYVTNLNDAFKMGDNLTDLVFIEGIFDINANNPLDHSPTIGVGDYFVLNTHASYSGTAISRILKYVSFDSVSNSLLFRDVSTLQDYDITYSTSGLANGTMGFATLTVDNTGHGVYVMNVSTGNAPLVIDLNANSVVNNNERVWITFNGGGVIDPLAVGALAGGVWSSHSSDPNDMYGNWSDNGTTSTANEMSFALVSFFEEFGYNSDIQSGSNDYCAFDDSSLNCTNYALTPGTVAFDITNNAGETFAGLVAEVDGCLASNSNPVTLLDGATGTFNFDSCSGQNMPGIRISKNFSLNRTTGSGCSGSNCIIETYTGSMISLIVGSDPICINEQTDIKIAKVGNNQLTIDGTNTPTCEFSLEQNQTGESFFGMTNYGANYFINLSDPIGSINGETLEIDYPIQQKRGLVIIGTGGDSSSSCSPNCPDPSSVACGDPIIPTNGCGSCGGSGTYCGSGLTCDGNDCVSCTPDCSGKQCGSDGCGGSCGSCGGSDVCSNNLCCTPLNNTQACTDNNYTCGNVDDGCGGNVDCGDCSSGETCSSNVCVDDGGDPHDTYYFNLSNNYEYFDLDEEDEVIVQGLDDDYNVILRTVWSSGRIRLSLPQTSYLWLYIEAVGNTINIDLDEDGITDINVKSIEIDAVDDEAELRFSAGEYTGSNNGGSGGGSGGGTVCGDGNCEGSENTITCPTDCGTSVSTGTGVNVANNQPTNTRSASSTTSTVVKSDSRAVLWLILGILITIIMIMVIYSFVRSGKGSQKKYGQINKNYSEQDKPRVGW